ncbi:hypothetical protein P2P98_03095 [Microbacterium sp. Kw_RZR3]|uniref:hypothetical protein n=1 Tax=Microbacterium sp. Kw_RZR3 TaxID=3032903 RepID=UPI0023DA0294|nr:hypothetical protein [Microbacterium sp. Kw_RZR3]MDF2045135.1 hypothetical protein [Microbacterium sp. Kw_RZR3]
MSDDVHVSPIGDLIEHDTNGGECPCGPTAKPVERADGSMGWIILHHSLDGREYTERDYTGPAMLRER